MAGLAAEPAGQMIGRPGTDPNLPYNFQLASTQIDLVQARAERVRVIAEILKAVQFGETPPQAHRRKTQVSCDQRVQCQGQ